MPKNTVLVLHVVAVPRVEEAELMSYQSAHRHCPTPCRTDAGIGLGIGLCVFWKSGRPNLHESNLDGFNQQFLSLKDLCTNPLQNVAQVLLWSSVPRRPLGFAAAPALAPALRRPAAALAALAPLVRKDPA